MDGQVTAVTARKRSKLALVSWVMTLLYLIYIVAYFGNAVGSTTGSEQFGVAVATALVVPHVLCVGIGLVFNMLGYFLSNRAFVLVGAILYSVAILFFMMYFMFVIVQMVLSYVAYGTMSKDR